MMWLISIIIILFVWYKYRNLWTISITIAGLIMMSMVFILASNINAGKHIKQYKQHEEIQLYSLMETTGKFIFAITPSYNDELNIYTFIKENNEFRSISFSLDDMPIIKDNTKSPAILTYVGSYNSTWLWPLEITDYKYKMRIPQDSIITIK